jgi:hypothetical protein
LVLERADSEPQPEVRFALEVSALHLARAIPDYWYTVGELVAQEANLAGRESRELSGRLLQALEEVFSKARHYRLIDALRRWDFHWEPLQDPASFHIDDVVRRGAPMKLSTGPNPNSIAGVAGFEPFFSGSGRRLGRANYYEIQKSAFVDEEVKLALPLRYAILEFLDDLPSCHAAAMAIPEIKVYFEHPMRRTLPDPFSDFELPAT